MKTYRTYQYHKYISDWLRAVEQGKVHTCREQKQLCAFLRGVLDDENTVFDPHPVEDYVRITEKYFFKLMPDQKCYASLILGLREKDTGQLIFNQIFIMAGRGWGKNGFISSLAFYLTSKNYGIPKYHIHIVANSEEQAKVSFAEVYDAIDDMGTKGARLYDKTLTRIKTKATRSEILYKTSNANTKDGGRPGAVIFDEIHAYKNYDNIKVFTGGLGKTKDPRRIYITTDGEIRDGVIDDYKERARKILTGETEHKGFLPIIMKLDTVQEVGKPELWDKACPRINYSEELKRQMQAEYDEMLLNESLKEAFVTKRMNIPFTSKVKSVCEWDDLVAACSRPWIDLVGVECVGSIDYADIRDFASAGLRWKVDGKTYFLQHSWIHEKSLALAKYNIDIDECVKKGWATIVKTEDHATIAPEIIGQWFIDKMQAGYYITKIKGDRFRVQAVKEAFEHMGLPELIEVGSGYISHNKTAPLIDQMFANGDVVFEDDKLLRWYFWNVKREVDDKGNVTYKKIEPIRRKTDGFFCFLHSLIDDDLGECVAVPFFDVQTY